MAQHLALVHSVALAALMAATGCSKTEPTAVRIEDPDRHWRSEGFVEMVTPLAPPTSPDGRDRITVWLKVGDGEKIALGPSLLYPAGTVADRVEYTGERVTDVRGTRFVSCGAELFHVLRPSGAELVGYEWRRGDADLGRRATELAVALVEPRARERFGRDNDCGGCHLYDRPPLTRGDDPGPRRATDSDGLYQMLAVLSDDPVPLDHHRPREDNVESPYVRTSCPGGAAPKLLEDGRGGRRFVCEDGGVPLGRMDIERAREDGDPRALAVCESRRYLADHMDAPARAAFAASFRTCGL